MAALDKDHLVVRVVYTGPPMAGKTQSVRALMPLLRGKGVDQHVQSPGEWRGRTAFFDWADYEGGTYEGKPIRCQILSTPGQVALSDRRELLLRSADAVVIVVASQVDAMERAVQCYEEMAPWLAEAGRDVPIPLILQCNKQDLPGALPAEELARNLALPCGNDVFATSARTGKGLRAAFVASVHRAVDRARALVGMGLVLDAPVIASGEELFERMRRQVAPIGSSQRRSGLPPSAERVARVDARATSPRGQAGAPSARPAASSTRPPRPSRSGLFPSSAPTSRTPVAASGSSSAVGSGAQGSTPGPSEPSRGSALPGSTESPSVGTVSARAAGASALPRPPASDRGNPAAGGAEPAARSPWGQGSSSASSRGASKPPPRPVRPQPASGARAPSVRQPTPADAPGTIGEDGAGASAPSPTPASPSRPRAAPLVADTPPANTVTVPAPAATELEPASSARRAIVPPHDEPPVGIEPRLSLEQALPRRERGWLDPAGAAARAWRPGSDPRPAVMPASAYHVWVPAPSKPNRPMRLRDAVREVLADPPDEVSPAPRLDPGSAASSSQATPTSVASNGVSPEKAAVMPARPAVMPASAWRASLSLGAGSVREASGPALSDSEATSAPPSLRLLQGGTQRRLEAARPPGQRPPLTLLLRPAVMPASAWQTSLWAAEAAPSTDRMPDAERSEPRATQGAARDREPSDAAVPSSFPGPNLPGHARPLRAVWRRACWRTLETQITGSASALRDARGRWIGELAPGWFARTLRSAPDQRSARRAFAEEVLRERQLRRYLSRPRCVVLTEEPDRFWIWQVVCRIPTLATMLRPRLAARPSPGAVAEALLDVARGYLDARDRFSGARVPLPLSPYVLSQQEGIMVYAGLMPDPGALYAEPAGDGYAAFEDALREIWPDAPIDAPAVLAELHGKAAGKLPEPLPEIIRRVVEGR